MQHRTAFIIAAALTAFVLVFIGGLTAAVTPKAIAISPSETPTDTATSTATSTLTSTATSTSTKTPTKTNTVISILSPEQAVRIAARLAPGGKLTKPAELVNFKGKMAYEVMFDVGAVYVEAFSGRILFSGIGLAPTATAAPVVVDNGNGGGGGGGGGRGGGGNINPAPQPPAPPQVAPPPQKTGGDDGHGGGHGGDD